MSRIHPGRFHIAIPGPTNIPERIPTIPPNPINSKMFTEISAIGR